ncbi:cytokinesis protein 3, partial [Nowakowskiella sp. JEL0407]
METSKPDSRESEAYKFISSTCCEECASNLVARGYKSIKAITRLSENSLSSYGITEGHLDTLFPAIEELKLSAKKNTVSDVSHQTPAPEATSTSATDSTPGNSSQQSEGLEYDVMLSYAWAHKVKVLQIRDALTSRGFKVWIDEERMSENIYKAMHNAIVSSEIIVPCLSKEYENSANCNRELFHTADLKKRIVPIRLDNGPFTWSALITSGKVYIDFSNTPASNW